MTLISKTKLYVYMGCILIFGSSNTIILKKIDITESRGSKFQHPFVQCAIMFTSQFLCLILYLIEEPKLPSRSFEKNHETGLSASLTLHERYGKKLFAIPSLFDLTATSIGFLGLVYTAPSINQMLRGVLIIVVAVYSIIFLHRKIYRHQWLGVFLISVGVISIGFISVIKQAPSAENPILGIILQFISQLFAGGLFVAQEKLIKNIKIHPLQAVGIEGFSGSIFLVFILPILNLVPCRSQEFCNGGVVENTVEALKEIQENPVLLGLILGCLGVMAVLNWAGISTTLYSSALARSTIENSRTVLVWGVSIAFGWEEFLWEESVSFLLIVLGTLVYNEIVVLPFCGFKKSVKLHNQDIQDSSKLKFYEEENSQELDQFEILEENEVEIEDYQQNDEI